VQGLVVSVVADPDLRLEADVRPVLVGALDHLANLALVAACRRGVDVPVPGTECGADSIRGLVWGVWKTPRLLAAGRELADEIGQATVVLIPSATSPSIQVPAAIRADAPAFPPCERFGDATLGPTASPDDWLATKRALRRPCGPTTDSDGARWWNFNNHRAGENAKRESTRRSVALSLQGTSAYLRRRGRQALARRRNDSRPAAGVVGTGRLPIRGRCR
jgi:hypothetical protein